MASIELRNIRKQFGNTVVLPDISFTVREDEFVVLVGPSGCGKSTILRTIAGLETPTSGEVWIGGKNITQVHPRDRDIAMVFQSYALYPHLTVYDNMAFGLRMRKTDEATIDQRVKEAASFFELGDLLKRKPKELSGGQRQRVALGRAVVRHPSAFLFDEPLSNLDAKLRAHTRTEISRLHKRLKTAMVYVTHDQIEAMTLGERIVVLRDGLIQQIDTPLNVYRKPANKFVAGFIGSPAMNFVAGQREGGEFKSGQLKFALPQTLQKNCPEKIVLGLRPEQVGVGRGQNGAVSFELVVDVIEPIGNELLVYGRAGDQELIVRCDPRTEAAPDSKLPVFFDPNAVHYFDAGNEASLAQA
ncbi:MAG: sn-glycerol-3-phosphate ABC transporter ATP-binding protein UgpC [Calditrichaeota bacterium]|nr:sn-glycerol-3-phosphate ABC transporter ATP-binding protein UgpC [Calditrichota bacterium]MCB9367206.1 sn-glycerol-3-phosphate ABC transporter ATP-binding protein UgpC [Calditrichota bacterium]MCB9391806.1 sn-glycerol-3-phosphate ABC transporter ATP-binding protein UgpC [Calditrichota bacterium]